MIEPSEEVIKEAFRHAPMTVVKIDRAFAHKYPKSNRFIVLPENQNRPPVAFKVEGPSLIIELAKLGEVLSEELGEDETDEDRGYLVRLAEMTRAELEALPEHDGW